MKITTKIRPFLWFDTQAREAAHFYCSLFPNSRIVREVKIADTPSGPIEIIDFELSGQPFQAMSAGPRFQFTEAISLVVLCEDQAEVDHYWHSLSAHPASEACGWLKDRYGLSWQIIPSEMTDMMASGDPAAVQRLTQAMLTMKKFHIAALRQAFTG